MTKQEAEKALSELPDIYMTMGKLQPAIDRGKQGSPRNNDLIKRRDQLAKKGEELVKALFRYIGDK
jgi:hypothetical protein